MGPLQSLSAPGEGLDTALVLQQPLGAVQCIHLTIRPQKELTGARSQLVGVRTRCLWR